MSTVRNTVAYIRSVIEGITPLEVPGRLFRYCGSVPENTPPAYDREVLIVPVDVVGVGTPIARSSLSVVHKYVVFVKYVGDTANDDNVFRIAQDSQQIVINLCATPKSSSAPWHTISFESASVQGPTDDGPFWLLTLTFDISQVVG